MHVSLYKVPRRHIRTYLLMYLFPTPLKPARTNGIICLLKSSRIHLQLLPLCEFKWLLLH